MVSVTGLTEEKMVEIDGLSIVDSDVVGNNLILTRRDGSTVDAGSVKGVDGGGGVLGDKYFARSTSTQSLTTGVITDVTSYAFVSGLSTLFTIGSGTTFTANQAGLYYIKHAVYFGSGGSTSRRISLIYLNGVEIRRVDTGSRGSNDLVGVTTMVNLAIGDVLNFKAYQNSGAAVSLVSSGHDVRIVKIM